MPKVRVLRVLEYTGDLEKVMADLEIRGVKGSVTYGNPGSRVTIREAIIGGYPEILEEKEDGTQDGNNSDISDKGEASGRE